MKKAKIMLVAIAVLGIVGGTVAFKAKSAFTGVTYYTTAVASKPATITYLNAVTTLVGTTKFYWTTVPSAVPPVVNFSYLTTSL